MLWNVTYVLHRLRGPSYTSIDQIKNTKLLHVRFHFNDQALDNDEDGLDEEDPLFQSCSSRVLGSKPATNAKIEKDSKSHARNFRETRRSLNMHSPKKEVKAPTFPKSVAISTILQLGEMIPAKRDEAIVELYLE